MQKYEIMTIYKLDQGEDKSKELSKKVQDMISSLEGVVENSNFWGKRKFAYEIKHNTEGFYDVINFEIDPLKIDSLKTKLNLVEGLVRYLITALN